MKPGIPNKTLQRTLVPRAAELSVSFKNIMNKQQFYIRYKKLLKVKDTKTAKIGRGQDFEALINDVLEDENVLLKRSYHTIDNMSEQIDGAIEILNRVILFEVKWVAKNLAASELYAFLGKIDNKLFGTLGLFISKNKLSDNFLSAITRGRKRNILLIHGNDISLIFKKNVSIKDYLEYCIKLYSYDNLTHYSVAEWLEKNENLLRAEKTTGEIEKIDKQAVKNILKKILVDTLVPKHEISLDIDDLNETEKIKVVDYLLREYPTYYNAYTKSVFTKRGKLENAENTLKILTVPEEITKKTYLKYYNLYIGNPVCSYLADFLWEKFKIYHEKLEDTVKSKFEKALLKNFESIFNSWVDENRLTKVIEFIWPTINDSIKTTFFNLYIQIYFSDRKENYEQKQFASKIVNNPKNKNKIKKWIEGKIIDEIKSSSLTQEDITSEVKYFNRYYSKARAILSLNEEAWTTYLTKIYNENI